MLNAIIQSVVLKWLLRRVLEIGPIAGGALSWWSALSPADQAGLLNILQGNWGLASLGAVVSIGGYLWSFISTTTPHATAHGVQVPVSKMAPVQKAEVKDAVAAVKRRPTILDKLFAR